MIGKVLSSSHADCSGLTPPVWLPPSPVRIEDVDIPEHLLTDIALRHVYLRGTCTIHLLSDLMNVSLEVAEALFRRLSDQQYFEVRRTSGEDYVFALSNSGKRLVAERALTMRYAGPVPVSLRSYTESVRAQTPEVRVTREKLRDVFSDIVVSDRMLDSLGPALISQRSIFLYGPSGTGKTTIAERLVRVYDDAIVVPRAVEVDGQIIIVGDPAVHEAVSFPDLCNDARWMVCRRPFLAAGGELVTSMLDLQRDESTTTWWAPLQMKANNGILLIDDFGRQMMSPRDLLNRWIVPLDRRVDFLSLGSGKFDIPFEVLVVFSTNLSPQELADEAFLRRIPNKIAVDTIDDETFDAIFRITVAAAGIEPEPGAAAICRELCLGFVEDLRPCFPRDLCNAIRAMAVYEGRRPEVSREFLQRAAAGYFVQE